MKKSYLLSNLITIMTISVANGQAIEVIKVNHDDFPASNGFSFAYAGYGAPGAGNVTVNESITQFSEMSSNEGVDDSFVFKLTGDTSATDEAFVTPNDYTYSGFGIANDANLLTPLPTSDLSQYTLDIALKAGGLLDGKTQTSGLVDIRFYAPDGTLQPDDADFDQDIIFTARYSNSVFAGTDYIENQFRLNETYEVRQGSLENFQNHLAAINYASIIVEMNNAVGDFGFDAENTVLVDNLILTNSTPPPPPAEAPVVEINFDTNPRSWGGSYYAFAGPNANDVGNLGRTDAVILDSVSNSTVQVNCLDTTPWAGADPLNGGGYLGFAGVAAVEVQHAVFPSSLPEDYKLVFDAKSSGFLEVPGGKMLVSLLAPDDTLLPADANDARDLLVRFRIANDNGFGNGFSLPETYQTLAYNLGDVQVDSGSLEQFEQFKDQISVVEFALEGVSNSVNTGFDADNCIYMDNLQILHLTDPGPDFQIPEIISIVPNPNTPDQISLTFQSIPGHRYQLLATDHLTEDFVEISDLLATEQEEVFNIPLVERQFFKVEDLGVPVVE